MTRTFRALRTCLVIRPLLSLAVLAWLGLSPAAAGGSECPAAGRTPQGSVIDFDAYFDSFILDGDRAYVMHEELYCGWGCGRLLKLSIFDLSTPEPRKLGSTGNLNIGSIFDVVGGLAYVATHGQFHVIDASDPTALHETRNYNLGWPIDPACIAVVGTHAYVGDATGLLVVDVAEPVATAVIGRAAFPTKAVSVALVGSIAYVGTLDARLAIVDVSNPGAPDVVATVALPGTPWDIEVRGPHAYVSDGEAGLQIVDVSRPARPQLMGGVDTAGDARLVALSGARAYVVDRRITSWSGELPRTDLRVIDVSNPTNPVIVNSIEEVDSLDPNRYWLRTEIRSIAADKGRVITGTRVWHIWSGDCIASANWGCDYSTGYLTVAPRPAYEPSPPCSGRPSRGASRTNGAALASGAAMPTAFALRGNDPNPFNPETSIRFDVPRASRVRIQVSDARGRLVKTLVDDALPAGRHEASWRGRSESGQAVASGIYFVVMEAETFRQTRKITLLK